MDERPTDLQRVYDERKAAIGWQNCALRVVWGEGLETGQVEDVLRVENQQHVDSIVLHLGSDEA